MVTTYLFEPINLSLINRYFVTGIFGIPKDGTCHSYEESLFGNFSHKVGCILFVDTQKHFEIGLVGIKFINAFQIMIATHDVVRDTKSTQIIRRHFVTQGRSRKQFGIVQWIMIAIFRFTQITQTHERNIFRFGIVKYLFPLFLTDHVIFHFARINVQISQNTHDKLILFGHRQKRRSSCCSASNSSKSSIVVLSNRSKPVHNSSRRKYRNSNR
mmetsp:Transcript_33445/g.50457  ORF Transcript_33445/g.50457 Transcript_33445/m.50457 type:complete len:214 (+) Transcript_33445:1250-1891(+)